LVKAPVCNGEPIGVAKLFERLLLRDDAVDLGVHIVYTRNLFRWQVRPFLFALILRRPGAEDFGPAAVDLRDVFGIPWIVIGDSLHLLHQGSEDDVEVGVRALAFPDWPFVLSEVVLDAAGAAPARRR
jgi:hypothetical protein